MIVFVHGLVGQRFAVAEGEPAFGNKRPWGGHSGAVIPKEARLPVAGLDAATLRIQRYAQTEVATVRQGRGWFAVATGVSSNDMNAVVSGSPATIPIEVVDELIAWFQVQRLPASWLVTGNDPDLVAALVRRGARSEASGWWAGRTIGPDLLGLVPPTGIVLRRAVGDAALEAWLEVAEQCGWLDDEHDRSARRQLYLAVGLEDRALAHWVAYRQSQPVGMASSFITTDGVVDLCNLAVIAAERRKGIGLALAGERIRAANARGARTIVSALSPDGWRLYRSLGFTSVPVEPDRWFYLPAFDE